MGSSIKDECGSETLDVVQLFFLKLQNGHWAHCLGESLFEGTRLRACLKGDQGTTHLLGVCLQTHGEFGGSTRFPSLSRSL